MKEYQSITIKTTVNLPVEIVWKYWTEPEHIKNWNTASNDWHTTKAENDLRVGGSFLSRMEAKDGSIGFDFSGTYDEVKLYKTIEYTLGDNRKVRITFESNDDMSEITETFEAESTNPLDMQKAGWSSILESFKNYAEGIK